MKMKQGARHRLGAAEGVAVCAGRRGCWLGQGGVVVGCLGGGGVMNDTCM